MGPDGSGQMLFFFLPCAIKQVASHIYPAPHGGWAGMIIDRINMLGRRFEIIKALLVMV
jgi:hypothetical protein